MELSQTLANVKSPFLLQRGFRHGDTRALWDEVPGSEIRKFMRRETADHWKVTIGSVSDVVDATRPSVASTMLVVRRNNAQKQPIRRGDTPRLTKKERLE